MDFIVQIIIVLNWAANIIGCLFMYLVPIVPGWLSNTIISAVIGIILLIVFKHTSNQNSIGLIRKTINANLIAPRLFKDSLLVIFESMWNVIKNSLLLLVHALRPLAVMIIPLFLILSQMAMWYQARPLHTGEDALVSLKLNDNITHPFPDIAIQASSDYQVVQGPVKVLSKHEVYWTIKVLTEGYQKITFNVDGQKIDKDLAVGNGFMLISSMRPGKKLQDLIMFPREDAFKRNDIVQSISIKYPDRISWSSGTNWWVVYFFIASLIFAFLFKPIIKVKF